MRSARVGRTKPLDVAADVETVTPAIDGAIRLLSEFVVERAEATARKLGFGWVVTSDAPERWPDLKAAFAQSLDTGAPLPVSGEHCENVVFGDPQINHAARFWHDTTHIELGRNFETADELDVASKHLSDLEDHGFARGELVWRILHADFAGQTYLMAVAKRFPLHQRNFVLSCLNFGVERTVAASAR